MSKAEHLSLNGLVANDPKRTNGGSDGPVGTIFISTIGPLICINAYSDLGDLIYLHSTLHLPGAKMRSTLVRVFAIGVFAIGGATMAHAQQSGPARQSVDVGKYEYDSHCAVCHGSTGKGDGIYADQLKGTTVPDLTGLSKKNNGVFPFDRVYETIDGRRELQAHGTRDMPIWGKDFSAMNPIRGPYFNDEEFARVKIFALIEYIYRLQAK
jgi:mono/diheme cytochrome c family protein